MLPDKLVFVDLETTGARVNYDRIIEIGIVRVENNEIVDTYSTLVNPEIYLSPFIENMTGIQTHDLEYKPTFDVIKHEVLERLSDCTFVAHNVRFDYGFLRNEFKRYGISYNAKHFCTAKLSKFLFPQYIRHNLDAIVERFGFTCENRHRAFDDAKVLWDFYQQVQKQFNMSILVPAVDAALKKPSIPTNLPVKTLDALPEQPGVYIFYGTGEMPLYVGKSVNIKERVLSHFSNDYLTSREMSICSQTTRIETITTSGELGALIKESLLIKSMQPLYNRRLRNMQKLVVARKYRTEKGYDGVTLDTVAEIDPLATDEIVGIFRSKRQAKDYLQSIAKKYELCEKLLGLEKTTSACFANKLGKCKGACIGNENPLQYNLRFLMGYSKQKIQTWPFEGPIIIEEKDPHENTCDQFVIDKWCYLGSIHHNESTSDPKLDTSLTFDLDTYAILQRFLKSPTNSKKIKPITREELSKYLSA